MILTENGVTESINENFAENWTRFANYHFRVMSRHTEVRK